MAGMGRCCKRRYNSNLEESWVEIMGNEMLKKNSARGGRRDVAAVSDCNRGVVAAQE
jgi:hypothetical protein